MFVGKYNYKKTFTVGFISMAFSLLLFDWLNYEVWWHLAVHAIFIIIAIYSVYKLSLRVKIGNNSILDLNGFRSRKFKRSDYKGHQKNNGHIELIFNDDNKIILDINNITVVYDRKKVIGEQGIDILIKELER